MPYLTKGFSLGLFSRNGALILASRWAVIFLLGWPITVFGDAFTDTLGQIESQWTQIRFVLPKPKKAEAYKRLLATSNELLENYPNSAEAIYWQAMIKINLAEYENKFEALAIIHEVRDLFDKVIAMKPHFKEGSAYVVLGTLYYRVPGWPIAYGDKDKAEKLLKKGLELNPTGIDSNYFYGDFLLSQNRFEQAEIYFNKAMAAHSDDASNLGEIELKQQAKMGLENAKQHHNNHDVFHELFGL